MDRRFHPRAKVQFEARITNRTTRQPSAIGRLGDMSESGLSVLLPEGYTPGELVELELADSHLTGRVVYSIPDGVLFRNGIEVQKVEIGNSDLSSLLQRTLMETMPQVPGVDTVAEPSFI
jgi:PilZ domain